MARKQAKAKYKKTYLEAWKCGQCTFEWCYKTAKCPICTSTQTVRVI